MEFKDYYATLGVPKSGHRQGNQAGVPEARPEAPPRREPRRQGGRGEVQGDQRGERGARRSREAEEIRRAGRELARCTSRPSSTDSRYPGGGSPLRRIGGADPGDGGAWTINMGGPGGARTMSEDEMRDMFGSGGGEDPFSDFFRTFFGGGGAGGAARRGTRARRRAVEGGRDIESEVGADARRGVPRRDAPHLDHARRPRAHASTCAFPPGVKDGSRVRAAGEGEPGSNGGRVGRPLPARARFKPHPVFERKGDDLYVKVALPVTTAVLGGEAQVPTITGSVRLKVPETTQPGQIFRLKGHGMPHRRQGRHEGRSLRHDRRPASPLADEGAATSTGKR